MRQETRTLYFIDELSPEARDRAVRDMRADWCEPVDFVSDFYDAQALLQAFGIEPSKMAPRLSFYWDEYAAAVDGTWHAGAFDPLLAADWTQLAAEAEVIADAIAVLPSASASLTASGRNCRQTVDLDHEEPPTEQADDALINIEEALRSVVDYIHRMVLSTEEYQQSDEYLVELASANGWEYTRDGSRA